MPAPAPPSASRKNLAREVVQLLRTAILSGKLPPGGALAEPVLAERFGVSRAPVREALIELEREGLVEFKATGRTCVRTLARKDFEEIIEARSALESMAARRVAAVWSAAETAFLEKNIAAQAKAATLGELSRLDMELHAYVVRRSGNDRLAALWQTIRWQFEMALASTHRLQESLVFQPRAITVESHRCLLAALASGRPETAAKTMAAHIAGALEWFAADAPPDSSGQKRARTKRRATTGGLA